MGWILPFYLIPIVKTSDLNVKVLPDIPSLNFNFWGDVIIIIVIISPTLQHF
jgi:hypothetical protein